MVNSLPIRAYTLSRSNVCTARFVLNLCFATNERETASTWVKVWLTADQVKLLNEKGIYPSDGTALL